MFRQFAPLKICTRCKFLRKVDNPAVLWYNRDGRGSPAGADVPAAYAAGGGAVEVTVSGKKEITSVKLKEEVVDPDDIEMLEDLIMAAVNEALRKVEEASASSMSKLTGGLGMGGLF